MLQLLHKTLVVLFGLILVVAAVVYFFVATNFGTPSQDIPTKLIEARRTGDYATTLQELMAIRNDPSKSVEEKAIAAYTATGARFYLSGNFNDRLQDIRDLKQIILDSAVTLQTRVGALNTLAGAFTDSGTDPLAFDELFRDAPFNQFLATDDPELSTRRLYEWSYSMLPTARAAIHIAVWYSEQYVINPLQSASTTKSYAAVAEDFLKKADALSVQEAQRDSRYLDSFTYIDYRIWRAIVIGRLSPQIGEPYTSQYPRVYDEFISFAKGSKNVNAQSNLFYARYIYAARLALDGDTKAARSQLDALADELVALENPDLNSFVRMLRNERIKRPKGINWAAAQRAFNISPSFKSAVERLIATTPASTTDAPTIPTNDNY